MTADSQQTEYEAGFIPHGPIVCCPVCARGPFVHGNQCELPAMLAVARAEGRAGADERIAGLERDLETAQHNTTRHNQDLAAVPFQVAWQRDQQQERTETLEGALRDLVEALREHVAQGREWPTAVGHAFVDAQLLLGYGDVTIGLPSKGAERA